MDYKKKYKNLVEAIKVMRDVNPSDEGLHNWINDNVPELQESEDERIRKALIRYHKRTIDIDGIKGSEIVSWLEKQKEYESTDFEYVWDRTDCGDLTSALDKYSEEAIINMCHAWYDKGIELERKSWLEKQGEQNLADKAEPKFKQGCWVVQNGLGVYKIIEVCKSWYEVISYNDGKQYSIGFDKENDCHLWAIADAKECDVLVCKGNIKGLNEIKYERICLFKNLDSAFFTLTKTSNGLEEYDIKYDINVNIDYPDNTVPATKEQKEILFMTMKEAGYTFFEKKTFFVKKTLKGNEE